MEVLKNNKTLKIKDILEASPSLISSNQLKGIKGGNIISSDIDVM